MSQLSENVKKLASETEKYFIDRSLGILDVLNEKLKPYAQKLLIELQEPVLFKRIPILYIPISHYHIMDLKKEHKMEKDITDILNIKVRIDDFIAIGEAVDGEYTVENRIIQIQNTLSKLVQLGIIPSNFMAQEELMKHQNGFEKALFKYSDEKKVLLYGVESLEGSIIATALDSPLNFVKNDPDGSFKNELKFRLGIEGRTRLALKKANQRANNAKRIVFFQGANHLEGVKKWCDRNSIELQIIIPHAIKDKFKKQNNEFEFIF